MRLVARRRRASSSSFYCAICCSHRTGQSVWINNDESSSTEVHQRLAAFALARDAAAFDRGKQRACNACLLAFRENNGTNTANPLAIGSTLGRRIAGLGLFVQRAYRRGERITRYGGRVLSIDEARAMPRRTHMRSLDTLRHVVDGSSGYRTASTSANHATVVGLAQFANTCTDDDGNKINCRAVKEYDSERLNVVAVWLEAARDIALGEELLVSYGRSFHRAVAARSHLAARLWRPANRAGNNALFWPSQRDATTNVVGDDAAVAAATPRYQLRTRKRKYE